MRRGADVLESIGEVVSPENVNTLLDQAHQLYQAGRFVEAEAAAKQILARRPADADALHLMGLVARRMGKVRSSVMYLTRASTARPDDNSIWNNLGVTYIATREFEAAEPVLRRSIALNGNLPSPQANLATVLRALNRAEEAAALCRRAITTWPDAAELRDALGGALRDMGDVHGAVAEYRRAVELKPDYAKARLNYAMALLLAGDFDNGWREYEARWMCTPLDGNVRQYSCPRWEGQEVQGKIVLVRAEQGLGTTIQFLRYAPLISDRGARVVIECQPELVSLIREGLRNVHEVKGPRDKITSACDFQVWACSLPRIFRTTLANVPADTYIKLPARPPVLPKKGNRPRVGIVWAGNPLQPNDRHRSCAFNAFAPLLASPEIDFCSLQKGVASQQLQSARNCSDVVDLSGRLSDLMTTATVIQELDAVVTVDTCAAHLAGSMGARVWVALAHNACWRWLIDRCDSPWYPTMRLERQPRPGDWTTVFSHIASEMKSFFK